MDGRIPSDDDHVEPVVFLSTADLPDPPMTWEERRDKWTAAQHLIKAKYDAGVPFFTKDQLRDIVRQLDTITQQREQGNHDETATISITGLDGLVVQFSIDTGKVYLHHQPRDGGVCIITKPQLLYHTITHLCASHSQDWFTACRAYLTVELAHSTEVRTRTNELVYPWPASDYATVKLKFEHAKHSLETLVTQLKSALAMVAIPPGINKIVALSCSSTTWANDDGAGAKRSIAQHILALKVRDFLATSYGSDAPEIKCYAQDPIYTAVDEQVLSSEGFVVVDDPRAFLEVDEESVVICLSPDIPVYQIIADIARPAILLWDRVTDEHANSFWANPASPRVMRMMEEYVEVDFPKRECFGDLTVYVRKEQGAGK